MPQYILLQFTGDRFLKANSTPDIPSNSKLYYGHPYLTWGCVSDLQRNGAELTTLSYFLPQYFITVSECR